MRQAIVIDDALLSAVKARAASEGKTMKAVVDQALREFLAGRTRPVADSSPTPVFRGGRGVRPGVDLTDNPALEDIMNAMPRCQRPSLRVP